MSTEFFETFGLVTCGMNPNTNSTELYWFNTDKTRWLTVKEDILNIKQGYSHIGLKIFQFHPRIFYAILIGGRNGENQYRNQITIYKFEPRGITVEASGIFKGVKDSTTGDFFPQNQWVVTEKDEKTRKMYVMGRFGTYFIEVKYNEESERVELNQVIYAEEGFEKHLRNYIR